MQIDWLPAGISLFAIVLFAVGLVTGRMPNAVIEPERATNPIGYWALGGLYAAIGIGSMYIALKPA